MLDLDRLDHFVIPASDVERLAAFYVRTLGMERVVFGDQRVALRFGDQKINLQPAGRYDGLVAARHLAGTADFCLVTRTPIAEARAHLESLGVELLAGPTPRTGALGPITSLYFRDPDGNLVELASYEPGGRANAGARR